MQLDNNFHQLILLVLLFNLFNMKARTCKFKEQYYNFRAQYFTCTLSDKRIATRLKPGSRVYNTFIAAVVIAVFRFPPHSCAPIEVSSDVLNY